MVAKKAILDATERIVGAPVRDAVVVAIRPPWVFGTAIVAFFVGLGLAKVVGIEGLVAFAIAGALSGLGLQLPMKTRFLVRTEQGLWLTGVNRWVGRPTSLVGAVDPHSVAITRGFITHRVTLNRDAYRIGRQFESRLHAMLNGLADSSHP